MCVCFSYHKFVIVCSAAWISNTFAISTIILIILQSLYWKIKRDNTGISAHAYFNFTTLYVGITPRIWYYFLLTIWQGECVHFRVVHFDFAIIIALNISFRKLLKQFHQLLSIPFAIDTQGNRK